MKKLITILSALFLLCVAAFAQTHVDADKLGKTLEKNKDASAEFVSEIDLSGLTVASDGTVTIPFLAKSKVSLVARMDMAEISARIAHAGKTTFAVTFRTRSVKPKVYAITKIDGIESASEYRARLAAEEKRRTEAARAAGEQRAAEEKRRAEEERLVSPTKMPVQVVNLEAVNLGASEATWLPGQVQDKLKSNLQEHLGMKTVVDAKSEAALKKLQAESESDARDESTAIELGKITTAKFALFVKVRRTGSGYTLSADFTDLTTGEQMASAISKEYTSAEYLYGSTGAVDELTLALAGKLGIPLPDLTKNLLSNGSATFTTDEQLALAKQNEEQFKKLMSQYDAELASLSRSNDLAAVENKKKIEAEKALLAEKQKSEQKRQEELRAQKAREQADAKLEAERSIALKTQRDQMARDAAAKAAEVRKLKLERQGVLGQISVIESKKKALVEIRNSVEARSQELYAQLVKDRESEEQRIRNKSYSTVELENGYPTTAARERREKQVVKSYEDLTNKFFADCDTVKASTQAQDNALLAEIRADQRALAATRTVSSMGDELKVSFGTYEGSQNGWRTYLSLYSDGVLLYTDSFIVGYEALSGKRAPNMETELDDAVIEEYTNNVDMYSSLLTRGDPIIYFEIDYTACAVVDDEPSAYMFIFNKIRVINTVSGKTVQTSTLAKVRPHTMKPEQDLREHAGIVVKEKARFDAEKYPVEVYMAQGQSRTEAEKSVAFDKAFASIFGDSKMVAISREKYAMLSTEVTQKAYSAIMGENPSYFQFSNDKLNSKEKEALKNACGNDTSNLPVERVSSLNAIYFCNKLSEKLGLTPVYTVNGNNVTLDTRANGFRLPTTYEWEHAARGWRKYRYAGSDNLDEVGWYAGNSDRTTHPVAQKKPNDYGLYDMIGNVQEWVWDWQYTTTCSGSWESSAKDCEVSSRSRPYEVYGFNTLGFRVVRNVQ